MQLLEQKSFIRGIPPFDKISQIVLDKVVENLDIAYFKKDEVLMSKAKAPEFLYFIIKGRVQERDDDKVISLFCHHEFFDAVSLIEKHLKHDFIAVEESICYILPRDIFMEILHEDIGFEQYFFQSISQKLSNIQADAQNQELINFMVSRVKDAYLQKPLIVDQKLSIYDCVKLMKKESIDSLLVDKNGEIGIVTDTDFREKFILQRVSVDDDIVKLASFGLIDIAENEFLFNAQLKMTKHGIKRLIVKDGDKNIVGILDQISLSSFFASHTYAISNEIEVAQNIDDLKRVSEKLIRVTKSLFAKGVKVRYISKLISQLNGKIFQKLFLITAPKVLLDSSTLIVMGSEGREEQILKTDQDNALILADNIQIDKEELENFTTNFINTLISFGYPKCDGNIMLSNREWVMSESLFKKQILHWVDFQNSDGFMKLAILYDGISVAGDSKLLDSVKEYLVKNIEPSSAFFSHFAKASLSFETPLGLFTNFIVDENGLDIKKGALFAIVHGVRSLSIEHALKETNTVLRLKKLNDLGVIDRELSGDLIESFTFFLNIRLSSNLERLGRGDKTSNSINPKKLSKIEKDLLKDALKIVDQFKKFLTYHYKLNLLG